MIGPPPPRYPHTQLHAGYLPMVVLVWLGLCSSEASRGCPGVKKQMDLIFYLFLTGVCKVTEPSDTSTANANGIVK